MSEKNLLATKTRLQRRRVILRAIKIWVPRLRLLLFAVGIGWLFVLPYEKYNKQTYISENALLPGQASTHYGWPQVHEANGYRERIESLPDSSIERANYIATELHRAGLKSATQNFTANILGKEISGVNAFGVLRAPRGDGTEALVLSAPWISRDGVSINTNGVALALSIAKFFQSTEHTYWSKDVIILITDRGEAGVQAWLESYHDCSRSVISASPLLLRSGAIQAALNLDLPGTKDYQVMGISFEGVNGQLPNLDLINTIVHVIRSSTHVSIVLHENGHVYGVNDYGDYESSLYNLISEMKNQALGYSTGNHGLFFRYKIDAITLYGQTSNSGERHYLFYEMGTVVESTFRSLNNLLEHLHQSFFFYLLASPERYISIGAYLPPAILLAVGLILHALALWGSTGDDFNPVNNMPQQTSDDGTPVQEATIPLPFTRRPRRIVFSLAVLITTHITGVLIFFIMKNHILLKRIAKLFFIQDYLFSLALSALISATATSILLSVMESRFKKNRIVLAAAASSSPSQQKNDVQILEPAPDWIILKSFTLAFTGMIISCLSVLNFSLAVCTALIVIAPFSLFQPFNNIILRYLQLFVLVLMSPPALIILSGGDWDELSKWALTEYELLGNYLLPFVCCLYWPIVLAYTVIVRAPLK